MISKKITSITNFYLSVMKGSVHVNETTPTWDITPIVLVIPGLTSDSTAPVSCIPCFFYRYAS